MDEPDWEDFPEEDDEDWFDPYPMVVYAKKKASIIRMNKWQGRKNNLMSTNSLTAW